MSRFIRNLLAALAAGLALSQAYSATPVEALHEGLLDVKALLKGGLSYSDYRKRISEVVVLLDRYQRKGGPTSSLTLAAESYIAALSDWDDMNKMKQVRVPMPDIAPEFIVRLQALNDEQDRRWEQVMQRKWSRASDDLDAYAQSLTIRQRKSKPSDLAGKKQPETR